MTSLAIHARYDLRRDEFFAGGNVAAVTVEAGARFPEGKLAAHRLGQVVRGDYLIAGRDSETIGTGKVADEAFEEVTVFLKHPRLRMLPEDPLDRNTKRGGSIGDGVGALPIPGLDRVRITTNLSG